MSRIRTLLGLLVAVVMTVALSSATFAPATASTAREAAAARVTITPAIGLKTGQVVTIKGTGFAPRKLIYIVECSNTSGSAYCGTNKIKTATTSATGAFTAKFTVYTGKVGAKGVCKKGGKCLLIASDTVKTALAPIRFAS